MELITKGQYLRKTKSKNFKRYYIDHTTIKVFDVLNRHNLYIFYLSIKDKVFIYLKDLSSVLIPEDQEIDIMEITYDVLECSSWRSVKISDTIDSRFRNSNFILNGYWWCDCPDNESMTGTYDLVHADGTKIRYYVKQFGDSSGCYMTFDETLTIPIDIRSYFDKKHFIIAVLTLNDEKAGKEIEGSDFKG